MALLFCPFFILYRCYDVAEVALKALLWLDYELLALNVDALLSFEIIATVIQLAKVVRP